MYQNPCPLQIIADLADVDCDFAGQHYERVLVREATASSKDATINELAFDFIRKRS